MIVAPSSTSAQDSDILKLLEKTKLELDFANQKNKLLEDRLAAKDEIIKAKDGTIAVRDEQLQLAKDALTARTQVNTGDARILQACENQLAKAEARINSLEHPGFIKSLFDARTLSGAFMGYGIGRLTK